MSLHVPTTVSPTAETCGGIQFRSAQSKTNRSPGGQVCVEGFARQGSHCLQSRDNPHQVGPTGPTSGQQGSTCHSRSSRNVWPRSALQNTRTGKQGLGRIGRSLGSRKQCLTLSERMERYKAQTLWPGTGRRGKADRNSRAQELQRTLSAHLHSWGMSHQKS